MRRKIAALACAGMLGLCLVYSGCSASSAAQSYDSAYSTSNESSIAVEEPMEWGMGETAEGGISDTAQGTTSMTAQEVESAAAGEERKIIRTASLYIESREFDQSLSYLEQKVAEFGGYVESSTLEGNSYWNDSCRTANYTLRIPAENFDQFIGAAGGIGNITSKNIGSEEITSQYFDTQARLESLSLQEERLLDILEKAEKLTDVLELEQELADVRYQIETLTTTLNRYDQLISYSTVEVTIEEVYEITPVNPMPLSLTDRISQEFSSSVASVRQSVEGILVAVIGGSPKILWFLFWIAVLVLLILLIVRISTRSSQKAAKKRAQRLAAQISSGGQPVSPPAKASPDKKAGTPTAPPTYTPGQEYGVNPGKPDTPSKEEKKS